MMNNRVMAITAALILGIPALGVAAPIVAPYSGPEAEQLVEGHTVFTVIERQIETNTTSEKFAAAVAVLVREYRRDTAQARFPGVLWFNDQYLVNPNNAYDDAAAYRYPCGGAIMAVERGNPDPRAQLAEVTANGGTISSPGASGNTNDYARIDVDDGSTGGTAGVFSDTLGSADGLGIVSGVTGAPVDYVESYLITDPNDHRWIIDKYQGYSRTTLSGSGPTSTTDYVWVVNTMGSPAFIPDDGDTTCNPFWDLLDTSQPTTGYAEGENNNNLTAADDVYNYNETMDANSPLRHCQFEDQTGTFDLPRADAPAKDRPCEGGGNQNPVRYYNGVLYFKFEDMTQFTTGNHGTLTHGPSSTDTDGCQVGTEWVCPGNDDDQEGNSHPFHPGGKTDTAGYPCPNYWTDVGPNAGNHGGSDTPGVNDCSFGHATVEIDIYFSPAGRPFEPLRRDFDIMDLEGSSAPFHGDDTAHAP